MDCSNSQPQLFVAFDMDGCLVDTREAVEWAYWFVGVKMPTTAWGKPWHEWLPDYVGDPETAAQIHNDKNEVYLKMLDTAALTVLPPMHVLEKAVQESTFGVGVLTGASEQAARKILGDHMIERMTVGYGMTSASKTTVLETLRTEYDDVVYVDDDWSRGALVAAQADVRFIHYDGQTEKELEKELWTL